MMYKNFIYLIPVIIAITVGGLLSCATTKKIFAIDSESKSTAPIQNPFPEESLKKQEKSDNIIIRTKKGDRAIEVELPGSQATMTDFVVPVSPSFKEETKSLAYNESEPFTDDRYKERQAGITDREITGEFKPAMSSDNDKEAKQREIESELGLVPADDTTPEHDKSYLAAVDHIKQLYRKNRHEAALIEIDDLLKLYPSDSKIYAMRGTLLHRIGKLDLALQSWNQALKLEPNNLSLKRFIERKQQKRSLASP